MLAQAAQQEAAAAPPRWPRCQNKLIRLPVGHGTTIQIRFGRIRVEHVRGYGKRSRK